MNRAEDIISSQRDDIASSTPLLGAVESAVAPGARRTAKSRRRRSSPVLRVAALVLLGVAFATPILWMLSTALKTDSQLASSVPVLIPDPAMWSNFIDAWTRAPFDVYLRNSMIVTIASTVGQVISSALVGYGFARLRFPGRDVLFIVLLATMMIPQIVLLIPQFMLFRTLGWIDTFLPLTVPAFFGAAPFLIFLMRQHFLSIPVSLTEAARIDGASEWAIFARIIMPLSVPVTATVAIFSALAAWNDFLAPLIYLTSDSNKTLMLGLQSFVGQNNQQYQLMMAASLLVALPTLILYFIFQKHFMRSVVLTGTTG